MFRFEVELARGVAVARTDTERVTRAVLPGVRRPRRPDAGRTDPGHRLGEHRAQLGRLPVATGWRHPGAALLVHLVSRQPDRAGTQDRGALPRQRRGRQHRRAQRFHRHRHGPDAWQRPMRNWHPVPGRFHRMVRQLRPAALPGPVRGGQGVDPPIDCECQMSRSHGHKALAGLVAALSVLTLLTGCAKTVEGTAAKAGSGDVPRNDNSANQYPNLLKECEVLTEDILAKTVGANPLDIQSTFVGAVCRWQAANPAGPTDITRFWYEQGRLQNEKKD